MKLHPSSLIPILCACLMASALAYSPKPDLTAAGAIATLKTDPNASPVYGETYNLGATGLRGWIYIDHNNVGDYGLLTYQSRQILVTVVGPGTPAAAVLAVDDLILGAKGGTGAVPAFTGGLPQGIRLCDWGCRDRGQWRRARPAALACGHHQHRHDHPAGDGFLFEHHSLQLSEVRVGSCKRP